VPILKIDGTELTTASFSVMRQLGMVVEHCYPFYLIFYDEVAFLYETAISHGFTFESSFEILFDEKHGNTPVYGTRVLYALV